jgi:hypothetical protein
MNSLETLSSAIRYLAPVMEPVDFRYINLLKASGYYTYHLLEYTKILPSANSACTYLLWFSQ